VTATTPSPTYHSIAGDSFIHLDWKLIDPTVPLLCFWCQKHGVLSHLQNNRTNFSKSHAFFPIWSGSGRPIYSVVMSYKCETCKLCCNANDGRLLATLPTHIRSIYPVDPIYATGSFHLTKNLTEDMELLMVTYASADLVSRKLYNKLGKEYTSKAATYLSQSPKQDFLTNNQFISGVFPPSGKTLRELYKQAQQSPLTHYGYSHLERYERELQSVEVRENELVAIDWTFAVVKNFNLPGAKAMFTMNKGSTKEIVTMAIVNSTSVSQISHLLTQSIKRRTYFQPRALYSDTTPHNKAFWGLLFGQQLTVLLGLFHLLHRITDTIDPKCEKYWQAMVRLKECFYTYQESDLEALLKALKDGTINNQGIKMTEQEIVRLRESKRWKQRYDTYLRKRMRTPDMIKMSLEQWVSDYKQASDEEGRQLFSRYTEKVVREQMTKVEHATEPEDLNTYLEIPPPPRSPNQLTRWQSNRAESPLEKAHQAMAHYANTGMNTDLADILTLAGITKRNVKSRWKVHVNERRLTGKEYNVPAHFSDLPPYWDHSLCIALNEEAQAQGLSELFPFTTHIRPHNGEQFLSSYFKSQDVRNKTHRANKKTKLCKCPQCTGVLLPPSTAVGTNNNPPAQTSKSPPAATQQLLQQNEQQAQQQQLQPHNPPPHQAIGPTFPLPLPPLPFSHHQYSCPPPTMQHYVATATNPFAPPQPMPSSATATIWHTPCDACFAFFPYYCPQYVDYRRRRDRGERVMGRPSHDPTCMKRKRETVAFI